jgi:hypothetical protein
MGNVPCQRDGFAVALPCQPIGDAADEQKHASAPDREMAHAFVRSANEDVAVNAARTLRDLDLLRVQDSRNCQAVVCIRNRKPARAYVVKPEIR